MSERYVIIMAAIGCHWLQITCPLDFVIWYVKFVSFGLHLQDDLDAP